MSQQSCAYSKPMYWDNTDNVFRELVGNPIHFASGNNWAYSVINCTSTGETIITESTSTLELIQNSTTKSEFYIRKDLSYGDVIITTFLLLFAIFGIIKAIADYWLPRKMDFKR